MTPTDLRVSTYASIATSAHDKDMARFNTLLIDPPLLNSSCAWASDPTHLRPLYHSTYTGAVATRTATKHGFVEGPSNGVVFTADGKSTLNTYGYSPHPLSSYIGWVRELLQDELPFAFGESRVERRKPVIISITTGLPAELDEMLAEIQVLRNELRVSLEGLEKPDPATLVAVELNTSCPNITGKPPPGLSFASLTPLLDVLASAFRADPSLTIGLKLPPYPDASRATEVIDHLSKYVFSFEGEEWSPFAYLACTNTLGSSLLVADQIAPERTQMAPLPLSTAASESPARERTLLDPALPPALGGLGGALIHPLALGTVFAVSNAIASSTEIAIRSIGVIGIGGVLDAAGARRMRHAGASAVACATALGAQGVSVFEEIVEGMDG